MGIRENNEAFSAQNYFKEHTYLLLNALIVFLYQPLEKSRNVL